jgi:serine/threonine-protein kinase
VDEQSTTPVRIGEVLAGKYRVERVIGTGGMGVVVEALHVELGQRVALKFMLPAAAENSAAVERFSREARASASLHSDNVVHVTDIGALATGEPFMVMEYLEGEDLGQILKTRGPLGVDEAIDYVLQACAGLAEAHMAGIIHRDLKPGNLFLARRVDTDSVVKIVDFGISKVRVDGAVGKLTDTRDLMGSPLYMSPEQLASSRDVDGRTDIWALGIIMYELLTGAAPFDGDTLPQICSAVLITQAPPILAKRPDLPVGLSAVVAKCLEKKAADRYASVTELAAALAEFAPPRSIVTLERIARLAGGKPPSTEERSHAPSERPHLELVVQPMAETSSTWGPADTRPIAPRSASRAWLAVAMIFVLFGSGALFAFGHRAELFGSLASGDSMTVVTTAASLPAPPEISATPSSAVEVASAPALAEPSATTPPRAPRRGALPSRGAWTLRRAPVATAAPSVDGVPAPGSAWTLDPEGSAVAPKSSATPKPSGTPKAVPGPYDDD